MFNAEPAPRISKLTARIMAVNSLPLVLLVGGVLYFSGYQDRLIQNEFDSMSKEAHQFAAALGEGAVISSDDERDLLSPELAQKMTERFAEISDTMDADDTRTRVFDSRGTVVTDMLTMGRKSTVQRLKLAPPGQWTGLEHWLKTVRAWWRKRLWSQNYPPYKEGLDMTSRDYEIVENALLGEEGRQVWIMPDGRILLGVAVPVQRYKEVLGSLLFTRTGNKIEQAVNEVQMDIFNLFLVTLMLTIMLSLYLGRTIANPLKELAHAARGLQAGRGGGMKWQLSIPEVSNKDEIGELAVALREMVSALGARMHAIETFAADVAHEIKNPLTSLHSAVETALKINDPVRQQKLMAVIAHDVKRLDRLITDISQASRLEAELNRAETNRIIIHDMLHMVADLYTMQDWEKEPRHAKVVLEGDKGSELAIRAAGNRLVQVFQNLIDNALSFTPVTGTVRISVERQGMAVVVRVRDEGPGIPENKLDAIFERFYSERPAGEAFGQHSGLGLSIAKQIVEAHKGRITAANIKDANGKVLGACFTVELPLA